jgi:tetratricopeptide (TPR) repeat protein
MADIHKMMDAGKHDEAVSKALAWRTEESGNVMAIVALGESLEAAGKLQLAARAYGSIIDLFPSRSDLRRFASTRLVSLKGAGEALSVDSLQKAAKQRPDHLSVHRLLAYALVRNGDLEAAFAALEVGVKRSYPSGRFRGGKRILLEDMGIVARAWLAKDESKSADITSRLRSVGAKVATKPSLRFVLNWETDANDVDFHIYDGQGGHAYYSQRKLSSGGELYDDVTTGYGPECFAIEGETLAFPYALQIHYYSRGPMGYGMGQVEVLQHDGMGGLAFDARPFVVMNDGAFLALGPINKPL